MSKLVIQKLSTVLFNNTVEVASSTSHFLPRGTIISFHSDSAPTGWHLCDGDGEYINEYGDSTPIPDLRGRFILGAGQGQDLTERLLDASGGAETHIITMAQMPKHNHNTSDSIDASGNIDASGAHTHTSDASGAPGLAVRSTGSTSYSGSDFNSDAIIDITAAPVALHINDASSHSHKIYSAGSGSAYNIMNPYYVLTYIIKV